MNYKELEAEVQDFIKIEPTLSDDECNRLAEELAKKIGFSIVDFWDLLDLTECSFYTLQLFEKCIKCGTVRLR